MTAVHKSDTLRTLENVFSPDPRITHYVQHDCHSGEMTPFTLEDFYEEVECIRLHDSVPVDIRIHFETARNLLLYSWFVYKFFQVAEMQAYASVELALKERIGEKKCGKGLRPRLRFAVEQGWIRDDGFEYYSPQEFSSFGGLKNSESSVPRPMPSPKSVSHMIAEILPKFRNELAHGSPMLVPTGFLFLGICADVVNQLFSTSDAADKG